MRWYLMRPVFELQQQLFDVQERWTLGDLGWCHYMLNLRTKAEKKAHAEAELNSKKRR